MLVKQGDGRVRRLLQLDALLRHALLRLDAMFAPVHGNKSPSFAAIRSVDGVLAASFDHKYR
jgi:hypothetical protein